MSNHTKGPWVVDEIWHLGCVNRLDPFRHIAMVSEYQTQPGDREENEANARLIAAAPDLLEALENLLDGYLYGCDRGTRRVNADKARAAIAKARGLATTDTNP